MDIHGPKTRGTVGHSRHVNTFDMLGYWIAISAMLVGHESWTILWFWLRICFHIPQTASLAPSPNRRGPHHRLSWIQPDKAAVALGELNKCCGHHYMRHHGKCAKGKSYSRTSICWTTWIRCSIWLILPKIHPLDTWISKEPLHLDEFLGSKEPPEFLIQNPATEVISGKVLLQVFVRHQLLGLLVGATELQQLAVQATKFATDPVEAMDPLDPCGPRSEAPWRHLGHLGAVGPNG